MFIRMSLAGAVSDSTISTRHNRTCNRAGTASGVMIVVSYPNTSAGKMLEEIGEIVCGVYHGLVITSHAPGSVDLIGGSCPG